MNKEDKKRFELMIAVIAETFETKLSSSRVDVYFNALRDIEFAEIQKAANHIVRTSKFFPKPSDFRDAIMPNIEEHAALAYDKLNEAILEHSAYSSVRFDDLTIHFVVNSLGGWVDVCNRPDDQEREKFWRKEFERLYKIYAAKEIVDMDRVPQLTGIIERENRKKGLEQHIPQLKLIGGALEKKAIESGGTSV